MKWLVTVFCSQQLPCNKVLLAEKKKKALKQQGLDIIGCIVDCCCIMGSGYNPDVTLSWFEWNFIPYTLVECSNNLHRGIFVILPFK
jgi:hypothetical protein